MAAMIYAQSRSEMQTIISMPLDLEYNANSHQQNRVEGIHQLLQEGSNGLCHQLDGSVICNQYSEPGMGASNPQQQQQQPCNGLLADAVTVASEDISCVPMSLPDMPTLDNTNPGYDNSSLLAMGGRPFLEESTPEQSIDDTCSLSENQSNAETDSSVGLKGLSWQAFMVNSWYKMCDSQLLEISNDEIASGVTVEADKGFNFSTWDESYVCQKKNHFQISVQIKFKRLPKYIKTNEHEIQHIHHLCLHLYGVKFEAPGAVIPIEQSKTDRSKLSYEPIIIDFPTSPDQVMKATACRLHFSETTANNMRKRGKPNPDQKYFALVVAIHAYTASYDYPVVAYVSERIIVRASNPGQFDNEGDSVWNKSCSGDSSSVHYHGRVGINTEAPDEALTVVGNVSVTGSVLHPSDKRLKQNIKKIPTKEMLDNIRNMTLYSYSFKHDAFVAPTQTNDRVAEKEEVGLIAQEVQMILPDAIHEKDFQGINDMRMINKDRILMELLGAVQELSKEKTANVLSLQQLSTFTLIVVSSIILFVLALFL